MATTIMCMLMSNTSSFGGTSPRSPMTTMLEAFIDGRQCEGPFYGDAACRANEVEAMLQAQGLTSRVMFKRGRHRALTVYQRRENRRRAQGS